MAEKAGKKLVVDACIARSAGERNNPISSACRQCLDLIRHHAHHIVMTEDIKQEWDKHQSDFARRWRLQMRARKKIEILRSDQLQKVDGLMDFIDTLEFQKAREDAYKDMHLIEAAIVSDKRIR